ncbi:MAG: AAA family ATPase, partial [Byssovorax sp.]
YVAYAIYGIIQLAPQILRDSIVGPLDGGQRYASDHASVDISGLARDHLPVILRQLGERYASELVDVFAADQTFVSRAEVTIGIDEPQLRANESRMATSVRSSHLVWNELTGGFFFNIPPITGGSMAHGHMTNELMAFAVGDMLFPYTPHVLTAERSAVQLFGRELSIRRTELVDTLLARTARAGKGEDPLSLLGQRARRYSMPIRDSLRIVDDLAVLRKNTSPLAPLADRLGRDVMQGAIQIADDGEMGFHPEGGSSGISMSLASSSVKALSSLSFYLRHLAQVGDFLIIDEPELNLHPDNQRRVAKLLVRMARSGIKVMISTHSDYIIREINNAIMLSADEGGELRKKYGYEEEDTITPDRVGAYLFDTRHAHPIEVKPTGIEVETIEREINSLNASSQDIYFTLFHGRES